MPRKLPQIIFIVQVIVGICLGSPPKYPYLVAAQKFSLKAYQEMEVAQTANEWGNDGGHGQKAMGLLDEVCKTLSSLAESSAATRPARTQSARHSGSPSRHIDLAGAQMFSQAAYKAMKAAQKYNEWDADGRARKVMDLLDEVNKELKASARSIKSAASRVPAGSPAANSTATGDPAATVRPNSILTNEAKAFLLAAQNGDLEKVRAMLRKDPALVSVKGNNGGTPLHWASVAGQKEVVSLLLASKSNVNATDSHQLTPLHYLAMEGRRGDAEGVAELLLANKPNVNAKDDDGETPLLMAAINGYTDLAKLLLANGADVSNSNSEGKTPLHGAAGKGHSDLVELLLANKAEVNALDRFRQTPLHWAAGYGHTNVVKLLLASNAAVNPTNNQGLTPVGLASMNDRKDIVELLREHGGR